MLYLIFGNNRNKAPATIDKEAKKQKKKTIGSSNIDKNKELNPVPITFEDNSNVNIIENIAPFYHGHNDSKWET